MNSLTPPPPLGTSLNSRPLDVRAVGSQSANLLRLIAIALPMTLLLACGGGGSGGGATPPTTMMPGTDDPMTPAPNPLAGLANVNVAAENSPTIQAVETITGATGANLFVSNAYEAGTLDDSDSTCLTTTCFLPINEISTTLSLPFNLSNPQPGLFLIDEANTNAPVMSITSTVTEGIMLDDSDVTLARGNLTATFAGSELEFRTFAGWIDGSVFFGTTQIQIGETNPEYRFISNNAGVPATDNPSATGSETSATWEGSAVASIKADRTFILGDATITIPTLASGIISVDVMLNNWRNLNNQAVSNVNVPLMVGIGMNGTFGRESTNTFEVQGQFYGAGHEGVSGWFNTPTVTGAFGGKRQ